MSALLAAIIGIGAALLCGKKKKKANFIIYPWKSELVTVAPWDGVGVARHVDDVPEKATIIGTARTMTLEEIEHLRVVLQAWNDAAEAAGKKGRFAFTTSQDADVRVFGASKLRDKRRGDTVLWERDGVVQKATVAFTDKGILGHEMGHARGMKDHTADGIMAERTNQKLPTAEDLRAF